GPAGIKGRAKESQGLLDGIGGSLAGTSERRLRGSSWKAPPSECRSVLMTCRLLSPSGGAAVPEPSVSPTTTPQIDHYSASYGASNRGTSPFFGTERISPFRGSAPERWFSLPARCSDSVSGPCEPAFRCGWKSS